MKITRENFPKVFASIVKGFEIEKKSLILDDYDYFLKIEGDTLIIKDFKCKRIELNGKIVNLSDFKTVKFDTVKSDSFEIRNIANCDIEYNFSFSLTFNIANVHSCNIYFSSFSISKTVLINISDSCLKYFRIRNTGMREGNLIINALNNLKDKAAIEKLLIDGFKFETLELRHINMNRLNLSSLSIKSLALQECKINDIWFSRLLIVNLDFHLLSPLKSNKDVKRIILDQCKFKEDIIFYICNFEQYIINLQNSDISKAKVYASILPTKFDFYHDLIYTETEFLSMQKDTILQIRNLAENANDNYALHQIKSVEHEVNYNLLKVKETALTWQDRYNKIVLGLNKITTNHGRNWLKPIIWYLGIGISFYAAIILINGECYSVNDNALFLNPAHKLDIFKNSDSLVEGTVIIDLLARLCHGYLAVQTVTTFRKILK